jgi:hypothetical protein
MKSGNLNFLEPSGLLQACNGNALPSFNTYSEPKTFTTLRNDKLTNFILDWITHKDATDNFLRNVCKQLPIYST